MHGVVIGDKVLLCIEMLVCASGLFRKVMHIAFTGEEIVP